MSIKSSNEQTGLSRKERLIIDAIVGHGKQIVRVEDLTPLYERNLVGLLEAAFILVRGDLPDIVARAFPTSCLLVMNRTQCFYTGSCKYLRSPHQGPKSKGEFSVGLQV